MAAKMEGSGEREEICGDEEWSDVCDERKEKRRREGSNGGSFLKFILSFLIFKNIYLYFTFPVYL